MLTDDQFAARLTTLMREETDDVRPAPDLSATLRRRRQRQALRVRIAVAVPVAAAVVATALIATAGPGGRAAPATVGRPQANLHDVAYISAHTQAALADVDDYLVQSEDRNAAGALANTRWSDAKSHRFRLDLYAGGVPEMSELTAGIGTDQETVLIVDYRQRKWARRPSALGGSALGRLRIRCMSYGCIGGHPLDPTEISKALGTGSLVLIGEQPVRGHTTLHLRVTGAPKELTGDLWVDPQTYLPVRFVMAEKQILDYTWLPRTPGNLAVFDLRPPPGFTRVR